MAEAPNQSIETLRNSPVQVTWTDEGYAGSVFGGGIRKVIGEFFSIDLQGQSYDELDELTPLGEEVCVPATFNGSIKYDDGGDKYLNAGTLRVDARFRRNGLGERLSRAMAYIAVEQGCIYIDVGFSHPAALKIFRHIYGDVRIHFYEIEDGKEKFLDITPDEASKIIQEERDRVVKYGVQQGTSSGYLIHHPETDEEILAGAVDGVDALVDVEGFDISGFERPIQTGVLPGSEPQDDQDF